MSTEFESTLDAFVAELRSTAGEAALPAPDRYTFVWRSSDLVVAAPTDAGPVCTIRSLSEDDRKRGGFTGERMIERSCTPSAAGRQLLVEAMRAADRRLHRAGRRGAASAARLLDCIANVDFADDREVVRARSVLASAGDLPGLRRRQEGLLGQGTAARLFPVLDPVTTGTVRADDTATLLRWEVAQRAAALEAARAHGAVPPDVGDLLAAITAAPGAADPRAVLRRLAETEETAAAPTRLVELARRADAVRLARARGVRLVTDFSRGVQFAAGRRVVDVDGDDVLSFPGAGILRWPAGSEACRWILMAPRNRLLDGWLAGDDARLAEVAAAMKLLGWLRVKRLAGPAVRLGEHLARAHALYGVLLDPREIDAVVDEVVAAGVARAQVPGGR